MGRQIALELEVTSPHAILSFCQSKHHLSKTHPGLSGGEGNAMKYGNLYRCHITPTWLHAWEGTAQTSQKRPTTGRGSLITAADHGWRSTRYTISLPHSGHALLCVGSPSLMQAWRSCPHLLNKICSHSMHLLCVCTLHACLGIRYEPGMR